MASVYKAYDPQEGRLVAIKVLSSDLAGDTRFSRRFKREAELVSQLTHPNIVPVWDYGEADGHAYLVMPFISVGNLADLLRRRELDLEECTKILDQVSSALDFAHGRGVVHRDIKPSNILLDENGNALLTDFGLAQIQDVSVSLTGSAMLGTPSYISPEQARGDPVDGRSDQYSLGIILFELATGYLPFDAETPMAVAIKHIQEPVPRPRQVNPRVPEAVEHVILKATSKDPKYRFKTTGEFNKAFQGALAHAFDPAGHPAPHIELPPPSVTLPLAPALGGRGGRGWGRRRRLTSLAALAVLLLVCGMATPSLAALLPRGNSGTPVAVLPTSSDPQLTALAATIQSLSTQMAATDGSGLSEAEMQAAVLLTITALAGTPTPDDEPPTLDATATSMEATWAPPTPWASFTPTRTQANPTQTSTVPSSTPTAPAPTETFTFFLAPSDTPTSSPTPTSALTSTWTPPPPPTATADICASTDLSAAGVEGREAHWQLTNQNASVITITAIFINWPYENDHLDRVELRNDTIWDRGDQSPPSDITSQWKPGGSRNLNPGESAGLDFRFSRDALTLGYSLNVTLNGACSVGSGQ